MRLAYIISAYKYPEQLIRLVHRLNCKAASFWIHVDKKTDERVHDQIVSGLSPFTNVRFLKRHRCDWGSFGHVRITLKAIEALVSSGPPFDYAILLTGQDYPIKPAHQIEAFFSAHEGKLFLDHFPLPSELWERQGADRINFWHFRLFGQHVSLPPRRLPVRRKFPTGFTPFGGSSYWCFSRECIQYLHRFVKDNQAFVSYFEYVDVPDELFFQTVIMNSQLADRVVNDDLRYIDWKDPDAGSPGILTREDFDELAHSSKLFARKFDMTVDATVLDMIDQQLLSL